MVSESRPIASTTRSSNAVPPAHLCPAGSRTRYSSEQKARGAGIGHNGVIIGPDLDTYYVSYHHQALPGRRIDLDSMFWNGQRMVVGADNEFSARSGAPSLRRPLGSFAHRCKLDVPGRRTHGASQAAPWCNPNVIAQSPILLSTLATTANYTVEINLTPHGHRLGLRSHFLVCRRE